MADVRRVPGAGGSWRTIHRFTSRVRNLFRNLFRGGGDDDDDDGVRLSVQETEPVPLHSSVRPFYSDYAIYSIYAPASVHNEELQLPVEETEPEHLQEGRVNTDSGFCFTHSIVQQE